MLTQAESVTGGARRMGTMALVAAVFAVCIGELVVAIPAVLNGLFQQDLGPSSSQLTWISDALLLPITVLELTFGVVGDLFGRKRLLIFGAVAVMIGAVVPIFTPGVGTATDTRMAMLWIGCGIAGIGSAALLPTSLAMVAAGTHTSEDRGRAIAIWSAALLGGAVVAPVLGGLVVKIPWGSDATATWRWMFVLIVVLGALSVLISARFAEDSSSPEGRSLDWPGQIAVMVGLGGLLFAIIQASNSGWGQPAVIIGFVFAGVGLAAFVLAELRSPAPLLHLDLFKRRSFAVTALITVISMFVLLGTQYATSVRLSAIQGFSPLKTSLAFLLLNGVAFLLLPLTTKILPRWNPRWSLLLGLACMIGGDFWMSATTASNFSYAPIIAPLAIFGIGSTFVLSSVTSVAVNSVPVSLAGMASAATSMLRDFGYTLGPAIIGVIALGRAGDTLRSKIAASPALHKAVTSFYALPAHVPAAQRASVTAAVNAVKSGPLGANGVPATVPGAHGHPVAFNPLRDVAFHALDHAYKHGYFICGCTVAVAFILAALALHGIHVTDASVDAGDIE